MKETTIKATTYSVDDDILIDIVELFDDVCQHPCYEAWIYRKDMGDKHLMFGMPKEQQSYDEFLEIVEANIDEYIDTVASREE